MSQPTMSQPSINQPSPTHSDAPDAAAPEAPGGYEKSAERDAKSNQAPGLLSRDTELKIARQMPDRK